MSWRWCQEVIFLYYTTSNSYAIASMTPCCNFVLCYRGSLLSHKNVLHLTSSSKKPPRPNTTAFCLPSLPECHNSGALGAVAGVYAPFHKLIVRLTIWTILRPFLHLYNCLSESLYFDTGLTVTQCQNFFYWVKIFVLAKTQQYKTYRIITTQTLQFYT